ncbi:catalase [Vibrio chagasii]|nr:catalase [Vibrio chagasii]
MFFLRDLKFPDLNHAVKRDPRTNMRSAKNNWDFWTSLPNTSPNHIVMSDRGILLLTATCMVLVATRFSFINKVIMSVSGLNSTSNLSKVLRTA